MQNLELNFQVFWRSEKGNSIDIKSLKRKMPINNSNRVKKKVKL